MKKVDKKKDDMLFKKYNKQIMLLLMKKRQIEMAILKLQIKDDQRIINGR